jgi:hypothetical protein
LQRPAGAGMLPVNGPPDGGLPLSHIPDCYGQFHIPTQCPCRPGRHPRRMKDCPRPQLPV